MEQLSVHTAGGFVLMETDTTDGDNKAEAVYCSVHMRAGYSTNIIQITDIF